MMSEAEGPFYSAYKVRFRQPEKEISEEARREKLFNMALMVSQSLNVVAVLLLASSLTGIDIISEILRYVQMVFVNPELVLRQIYPLYYFCILLYIGAWIMDIILMPYMKDKYGLPNIRYVKTMTAIKIFTLTIIIPFQQPATAALLSVYYLMSLFTAVKLAGRERW